MRSSYARVTMAVAFALFLGTLSLPASAALDMAVGSREVVKSEPVSNCNDRARSALNSVLQNAQQIGDGTGEWKAYAAPDYAGNVMAAAAVHCYQLGSGYVATFTCAVQAPPYQDSASGLCTKLATAFDAKTTAQR